MSETAHSQSAGDGRADAQRSFVWTLGLGILYYVSARFGLLLAFEESNASPVWPPAGIAFAGVLFLGYRVWPGILLGALLANFHVFLHNQVGPPSGILAVSSLVAAGNTLEALTGGFLFRRFIEHGKHLDRAADAFKFVAVAALMCLIGGTIGPTAVCASGMASWSAYGTIWFTWWLGDVAGVLIVTPLFLGWRQTPGGAARGRAVVVSLILLLVLVAASLLLLGGWLTGGVIDSLPYLVIPVLLWIVFRLGYREAVIATAVVSGMAIWGTVQGVGPFARASLNDSLLLLQGFVCVLAITILVLAAVVSERRQAEEGLRRAQDDLERRVRERTTELQAANDRLAREIDERTNAEQRQTLATRVLEVLNRPGSTAELIQDLLRVIKESTGFEAVGIRLREGEDFPYYQVAGFPAEFVEAERYLCSHDSHGQVVRDTDGHPLLECMCGNVIRGRTDSSRSFFSAAGSFYTNSTTELLAATTEEDRQARTRNRCHGEGYETVALIPLRSGAETIGLLQLNDHRKGLLEAEMIAFLEGIGASVGIALQRKGAEEALFRSENLVRTIIHAANDAMICVGEDGRITLFNPAAEKMFHRAPEEMIGQPLDGLMPEEYRDRHRDYVRSYFATGIPNAAMGKTLELPGVRADGTVFPMEVSLAPGRSAEGQFVLGVARDITERKQAEEKLQAYAVEMELKNLELETAKELIEKAVADLERSNRELDDFAYIASHDLKEPLRGIRNYSSFLLEDYGEQLDESGRAKLETLPRLAQRLDSLIDSLLHFSRVGRVDLAVEETDLNLVLSEVLDSLHITLAERRIEVHLPRPLPVVNCDRVRIAEVFRNLVSNAMKYNDKDEKWIEVGYLEGAEVGRVGGEPSTGPVLYVRDNGLGIRDKHHDAVFKMFKRLHGREAYGGGTGVGLTIVKRIVERHGGRVWIESRYGKGTTFYFNVPESGTEGQAHREKRVASMAG